MFLQSLPVNLEESCDLGLRQLCMNNALVKQFVGMIEGLAFVRGRDLLMGVNYLVTTMENNGNDGNLTRS